MRHSDATLMLEDGAELRSVKDPLGHVSIEETEGPTGTSNVIGTRLRPPSRSIHDPSLCVKLRQLGEAPRPRRTGNVSGRMAPTGSHDRSFRRRSPASRRTASVLGKQKRIFVRPSSGCA